MRKSRQSEVSRSLFQEVLPPAKVLVLRYHGPLYSFLFFKQRRSDLDILETAKEIFLRGTCFSLKIQWTTNSIEITEAFDKDKNDIQAAGHKTFL